MKLILSTLLFLSGCATIPAPEIVRSSEVVIVKCISSEVEKPTFLFQNSTTENVVQQVRLALAEIEQRKAYELKMEALIKGCVQ